MKTNTIIEMLPIELQQGVLNILTAYDRVIIDFENGKFKIGSYSLRDKYPADFKHIGIINNTDVYTDEEIKENYRNL